MINNFLLIGCCCCCFCFCFLRGFLKICWVIILIVRVKFERIIWSSWRRSRVSLVLWKIKASDEKYVNCQVLLNRPHGESGQHCTARSLILTRHDKRRPACLMLLCAKTHHIFSHIHKLRFIVVVIFITFSVKFEG